MRIPLLGLLLAMLFTVSCSLLQRRAEPQPIKKKPVAEVKEVKPERTTAASLEEQSLLNGNTGSLWVSRGQASYLFTNNNLRLIGDLVNVRIEGYPKEQIQTKVTVISKLLAQILSEEKNEVDELQQELDKQEPVIQRRLASDESEDEDEEEEELDEDERNELIKKAAEIKDQRRKNAKRLAQIGDESDEIKKLQQDPEISIKTMPTRVVEVMKNGNYLVRGTKPFMIGRREYRLLVSGMLRPEDYKDDGVSAEALLDPQFDVITEKKGELKL